MQEFVDQLAAGGWFPGLPLEVAYALVMLLFGAVVVFGFVLPVAGITTWVERRVAGRIQSRVGPNRVGPQGFLQWLADGIKGLLKEDVVPTGADGRPFRVYPYMVL